MRILVATYSLDVLGGTETHLATLLPALEARGHALALLYEQPAVRAGAGLERNCPGLPRWCATEIGTKTVLKEIDRWRPDVIYLHGLTDPNLEESLAGNYHTVLFAHGYYGTCGTGTKRHAWPRMQPCGRAIGPMCLLLHYPRRCGGFHPGVFWKTYRLQKRRRALLVRHRAILVASAHMRAEFAKHGVASDRLHLVPLFPNQLEPDAAAPKPRPRTGRILMAGRLTELKGGDFVIRSLPLAARKLGLSLKLIVAGEGPAGAAWQILAHRLGQPADFPGWVDEQRLDELRRQADLLAIPSLWPEPFGIVGIEAGCVGLPAAGFAVGGIPDWLIPGQTGESAPGHPATVEGLADAVVRALVDPRHHQRLRLGAWEMAQRFTLARHLELLEPILERAAHD